MDREEYLRDKYNDVPEACAECGGEIDTVVAYKNYEDYLLCHHCMEEDVRENFSEYCDIFKEEIIELIMEYSEA